MELFKKRMNALLGEDGNVGRMLVNKTDAVDDLTFKNDPNYHRGMLYDWDMNQLEEVDFKFEKTKVFSTDGPEIEYYIRFRPNYNPEFKFKDLHPSQDGLERYGFYIDVYDYSKKVFQKWMIVGKDDRTTRDRYCVFKCNWSLEWVYKNKYYSSVAVLLSSFNRDNPLNDQLGGTTIDGWNIVYVPNGLNVKHLKLGTRFIISDIEDSPLVFEVVKINSTSPLGVAKLYLKQTLFNSHKDFVGKITEDKYQHFNFKLPINDLLFGGSRHMICDCLNEEIDGSEDVKATLSSSNSILYVNGESISVRADNWLEGKYSWNIKIDDVDYELEELKDFFEIKIENETLSIRAINMVMLNYRVKISLLDLEMHIIDSVEMEVKV